MRVAILGAGFAGLGLAIRLRRQGEADFVVLERAGAPGGTWRDNTYPGCQCDVPSHLYSYSFAPNPDWTRSFALQAEILAYLERCVRDFGLAPFIRYHHEVLQASWDEPARRWRVRTTSGDLTADVLVAGYGPLSEPATPPIPGLDRFAGTCFHSAAWRHDHDLSDERVAVLGTGASAAQIVPSIQPRVRELLVFQRHPAWVLPRLDPAIGPRTRRLLRRVPWLQRATRAAIYWGRELLVPAFTRHPRWLRAVEGLARWHLRRQVADPALRRKLVPGYALGCKRVVLSNEYHPALAQPNVQVITEAIREVRARSIVTADGRERLVDTIVLATGFHVTDHPALHRLHGRDGRTLAAVWAASGMRAYLGTAVAGFPNLFLVLGPNTGLGHTSVVVMMEAQYRYILDALRTMRARGVSRLEVRPEAQAAFNEDLHRRLGRTVWNAGCASWYLDAQGRNPTLWPGSTWRYRLKMRRFDVQAYRLMPALAPGWQADPVPAR